MRSLKIFEGFAGYGGASFAFKKIKKKYKAFSYKTIAFAEIDKYATELFNANHNKDGKILYYNDITKITNLDKIPDFDMFTGGFPCQPFSTAGMQKGVDDPYGRGTLLHSILNICEVKKPKYILLENVKGILSKKFEPTLAFMQKKLKSLGYTNSIEEPALRICVLNSKDYGIPQNRERVWMFARLGGLPSSFSMEPPKCRNELKLKDFLDCPKLIPSNMYLSKEQIEHLKFKHDIDSFYVKEALCFDVYNKKIKYDGYSITITMPEHNSLRIIEPNNNNEVVRKMTVHEQFRLMGLESLHTKEIDLINHSYTQLSKRAGNGWDVNLVTILLEHIFKQLKLLGDDINI